MSEVLDIAFSLPTIIFTVSTIFLVGFWLVSTLVGAGVDSLNDFDMDLDADFDAEVDLDGDIDLEGDGGGLLRGALQFLGITGMPVLLALSLLSLFSWAICMIFMILAGDVSGAAAFLVGVLGLIGSFLLGGFLTGRLARRFSHVFVPTLALRRRELVGSVCTITTQRVTAEFGQAEVRDAEGASLIVQVRCRKDNDLVGGDRALIYDLDRETGLFQVSPDRSLAP